MSACDILTGLSPIAFDHKKITKRSQGYLTLKTCLFNVDYTCFRCEQLLMFLRVLTALLMFLRVITALLMFLRVITAPLMFLRVITAPLMFLRVTTVSYHISLVVL